MYLCMQPKANSLPIEQSFRIRSLVFERDQVFGAMEEAAVEQGTIAYSAAISACEKGNGWQHALTLFGVYPLHRVLITYNAAISACDKGSGMHCHSLRPTGTAEASRTNTSREAEHHSAGRFTPEWTCICTAL